MPTTTSPPPAWTDDDEPRRPRVLAVTTVRDELDILPWTLRHLLDQVDHMVVADNGSVDGTREWLADQAAGDERLVVVDDDEPGYWQARKTTTLVHVHARRVGLTADDVVVPWDADERWTLPTNLARHVGLGASVFTFLPWRYLPPTPCPEPDTDPTSGHRVVPGEVHPVVAFRYSPGAAVHMGNHGVSGLPGAVTITAAHHDGEVRHYPYRSLPQVARKARQGTEAYAATTPALRARYGTHWAELAALDSFGLAGWWDRYLSQPSEVRP